ncbi:MAG: glycosyltransferase family 2 protein [Acidobacteriota bacterium]
METAIATEELGIDELAKLFSVSVVIPVYNEAPALGKVLDDVKAAMERAGHPYEIVVVDDCSTDGSGDIALGRGVKVIRHPEQRGSGASRKTGTRAANGDVVVMLDADGTYPAAAIPEILAYFPAYDQVIGWRQKERGTHPILRGFAKYLIRQLACYLTQKNIPDLNSGMKAFKRAPMLAYLHLLPDGFSCVTTMTLAFLCNGYSIRYHPIEYYARIGTSKFHPIKDTWAYLLTAIRMVMYFNPLRVFLPLSIAMIVLGAIKTVYDVWTFDMQQSDIVIFVSAVVILAMGLLADLIVVQGKR